VRRSIPRPATRSRPSACSTRPRPRRRWPPPPPPSPAGARGRSPSAAGCCSPPGRGWSAIARLIEQEQGKPAAEAYLAELFPAAELLKHLARHAEDLLRDDPVEAQDQLLAHKESRLVYEPLGVVLAITPWNYPFAISVSSVAAALVAGNTVVLKPAPATTLVGLRLAELFRAAGLPDGVLSVLAVEDAVAAGLVRDRRVAKIAFTGSVGTGRKVLEGAAANLTPVVLELGGKDAAVVCRDADLDQAAQGVVWGAFFNAGQTCASVERVYVEKPVAEAFLARVVEHTQRLRVGDPAAGEVDVGPLTLPQQRALVDEHVADAVARGARVLTGGRPRPGATRPPSSAASTTPCGSCARRRSDRCCR
jgi:succinate-semialdehyde dehydrogenase/glutarate-semialdehyde dehydrogenase